MTDSQVLDATTGGKQMWFPDAKELDRVVYADRRRVESLEHQPGWSCDPSVLCDTRDLPFQSDTFDLVAYDPPHRVTDGGMSQLSGVIERKYGAIRAETWQADLEASFDELWRVLRPGGTLTFKWADVHKSHETVLSVLNQSPMYGVTTERDRSVTKWWVFHKP
jgi:SAM-dependent methyltransferase